MSGFLNGREVEALAKSLEMNKRIVLLWAGFLIWGCTPSPTPAPSATDTPREMTGALQADVQFSKSEYLPGEQIDVTVIGTGLDPKGWIGVIPSEIPHGSEETNDLHDINYKHLEDQLSLYLVAPAKPGKYDVRLNESDTGGQELASRAFTVVERPTPVQSSLKLVRSSYKPGETIRVDFVASPDYPENAWIGIVPSQVKHGSEADLDANNLVYQHLQKRSLGWLELKAPDKPGSYDVRMTDGDGEGAKEVASQTFQVGP